jgi:hypothetical protein
VSNASRGPSAEGPTSKGPSSKGHSSKGLSAEDLEAEQALALPEREALSRIDVGAGLGIDNFAMPINEATAINYASSDSIAVADADQIVIITQADQD